MFDTDYQLRYLPVFYEDLNRAVTYISRELNNIKAANDLINAVEKAILERQPAAESFEPYESKIDRKYPYYRIYVNNYIVFYVVIHDGDSRIMEVRRLLYNRQNRESLI